MPEEKKKDSFTFSDKIKNSKPAASSKSFANRISSKVGSDGKPRKTLFERTKRDAPFFIAALVALLLLPFLYKYSGSVSEEPVITPASEDSVFDPERYGFDTVTAGDPEGQIAALSGRDPLSLIKGWGKEEETVSNDYSSSLPEFSRDGFDERDSRSSSYDEVETNNTNIYKKAPAATRAAFRRAATKINPLGSAGLNSRGGGKLAVGMWGGGMKKAANKVTGPASPTNSPKPVSLQPLQAAGKPSRSYFGQGAAKEARRSKDAMSKANAMQALADAQVRAIEPGKIGGLLGGEGSGPGGGAANLKRDFSYKGEKPWWWDMMKQRSQMLWERDLKRKWAWEDWGDNLIRSILGNIATGVANCLITGEDDGSMGSMFGAVAGSGDPDKCGEYTKEEWEKCSECMQFGPFGKHACKMFISQFGENSAAAKKGWQDGNVAGANMGFFGKRLDCLSNGLGARFSGAFRRDKGTFAEKGDCSTFAKEGTYTADFSTAKGKEGKWEVYHYIVGIPANQLSTYYGETLKKRREMLVVGYIDKGPEFSRGADEAKLRKNFVPLFIESVAIKNRKTKDTAVKTDKTEKYTYNKDSLKVNVDCGDKGSLSCYQKALDECKTAKRAVTRRDCKAEINRQADNIALGKKIEVSVAEKAEWPTYDAFLNLLREGGVIQDADSVEAGQGKDALAVSTKGAKMGKSFVTGARCSYPLATISCQNFAIVEKGGKKYPYAHVAFANAMSKDNPSYTSMQDKFLITYHVQGEDNSFAGAYTTDASDKQGQVFPVPHTALKPFERAFSGSVTGAKSANVGSPSSTAYQGYQALATSDIVTNMLSEAGNKDDKRLVINWEIRQCSDVVASGDNINNGGCSFGTLVNKDNKPIGTQLPGTVVSSAYCVYDDDSEHIVGFEDKIGSNPVVVTKTPAPKSGEPKEIGLSGTVKGISGKYEERLGLKFPTLLNDFNTCRDLDDRISNKEVFDSLAVSEYVDSVITDVNASTNFQLESNPERIVLNHTSKSSVAHLVDAMTLAHSLNPSATVPKNVVCALGKTIGGLAEDPDMQKPVNNMFGAFAAYIDEESSFFPTRLNADGDKDWRFIGCRDNIATSKPQIHYGYYNWNQKKFGDLGYGNEGRDGFLKSLRDGGWDSFPLRDLAKKLDKNVTQEEIQEVNGTIDDVVRKRYIHQYRSVFDILQDKCDYTDDMKVEDALKYVNLVCKKGSRAKPTNGATDCNRNRFRASTVTGN